MSVSAIVRHRVRVPATEQHDPFGVCFRIDDTLGGTWLLKEGARKLSTELNVAVLATRCCVFSHPQLFCPFTHNGKWREIAALRRLSSTRPTQRLHNQCRPHMTDASFKLTRGEHQMIVELSAPALA